ncbi:MULTISPECIES: DUF4262 domain-containing protein [unclassified Actinotalea]|uniref:DUF4262 domain-containing protein n=1 Tax=unclassified Actinotalea TaxID=2638618 RepID=UPI0015F5A5D5|nr:MULTISPECIES: DUF4262 domain-containing protein [unclassified Actinotalea]
MCVECDEAAWGEGPRWGDEWSWFDEEARRPRGARYLEEIAETGWAVCTVPGDGLELPYGYTVGLTRYHGHPEVMVSGVDSCGAMEYLDRVGARVRAGERFGFGDEVELGAERGVFLAVDQPERLDIAQAVYGHPETSVVPALQLVVSDDAGRWPWERGWQGWAQVLYGTPRAVG